VFKLLFILKILPCYSVGLEPEPEPPEPEPPEPEPQEPPEPEPHQNFYPEPHKMMRLRNTEKNITC
jgi:hypothetical protein